MYQNITLYIIIFVNYKYTKREERAQLRKRQYKKIKNKNVFKIAYTVDIHFLRKISLLETVTMFLSSLN